MNKRRELVSYIITVILIGISVWLLLYFSGRTLTNSEKTLIHNNNQRAISSYLYNMISSMNNNRGIRISDDGKVLILIETVNGVNYETRIFVLNDSLVEIYMLEESSIDEDEAKTISHCVKFEVSFINDNLLKIDTDEGILFVQVVRQELCYGN